jgi:hypothetical protein|tara:strand:+ start:6430 stop:6954 length:525 start_codon:yes stop_codon:yes gene_type:complete
MSSTLGFSDFESNNDNDNDNKNLYSKFGIKNKTHKKREIHSNSSSRVENMLKHINNDESDLEDFTPPPKPISSGSERMKHRENQDDNDVKLEAFNDIKNEENEQWIPMYTNAASSSSVNNSELLEKINYMIHLLEEEKDVKLGNVTEEVVLYCFLGVFIIFVVDSFVKVGKYVR